MKCVPLIPVVSPGEEYSPAQDFDLLRPFAAALFDEGWEVEQITQWAQVVWDLRPAYLEFTARMRRN